MDEFKLHKFLKVMLSEISTQCDLWNDRLIETPLL